LNGLSYYKIQLRHNVISALDRGEEEYDEVDDANGRTTGMEGQLGGKISRLDNSVCFA